MTEWEKRLEAVLTSPTEGLICVERIEDMPNVINKEQQQDFYIQELQKDVAKIAGELFGHTGSGGFTGEVRKAMKDILDGQKEMQESMQCIDRDVREQKVNCANIVSKLESKITTAHVRLDDIDNRVIVLERTPGERSQGTISWVMKTAGYFIIGGLIVLLTLGFKAWL